MARSREQRRNRTGILRSTRNQRRQTDIPRQIEERSGFQWRIISGLMVICLGAVLALFFASDLFYVRSIVVSGNRYMTKEEVFSYADIANMHIFWVEPAAVRENIRQYPTVANVDVRLSWPPNMVSIQVEEREPALVWEQNGAVVWIDVQGNVMAQREDRDDLLRIVANDVDVLADGPLGEQQALSTDVVYAALQLQDLRPDVTQWRYDTVCGVGYTDSDGMTVWLGTGLNMAEKLDIYAAMKTRLQARNVPPSNINVVNPDAPFYTRTGC